jgi:hypothetical protein
MTWTKEDSEGLLRSEVECDLTDYPERAIAHIEALEARVAELEAGLVGPEARKRAENIYMCRVRSALGITGSECSELTRLRAVCAGVARGLEQALEYGEANGAMDFDDVTLLATRLESATHPTPGDSK